MSEQGSFLDCDSTILENNLRIIKNDYEDEFQQMFNNTENSQQEQKNFKIVKPIPALRCATPHNSSKTKSKRKGISLGMKIKILDRLAAGEGSTSVGRYFGIHESTIRTIKRNEAAIRSCIIRNPAKEHSFKALKYVTRYNSSETKPKKQDHSLDIDSKKSPNSFKRKAKKRKGISLGIKLQILDRLAGGEGSTSVGRHFGIHESTIRNIKKNELAIRNSVISGMKLNTKTTSYTRDIIKAKMEKALILWIKENSRKGIQVDKHSIKLTALKIYKQIQETNRCTSNLFKNYDFTASHTWMSRFFERHNLNNMKVKNEKVSAFHESVQKSSFELNKIVKDGGYTSHQVFNTSCTCIFWKKIPRKTYLAKLPDDFGVKEDHVTFLFCSNASGDKILKPMLVSRSLIPQPTKKLPVYWMTSEHPWVTTNIFTNWFNKCFVPEVKRYLKKNGLEFKVLLILHNESGYEDLKHPNVQFCFLPFNRTSLLQPLDRGIISAFKTYYIKQLFQYILKEISNKKLTVTDAWKKFSIIDCINLVRLALSELKPSILNTAWKTIWPECVEHEDPIPLNIIEFPKIINLAHQIGGEGFNVISSVDIDELLIDKPISSDEIVETVLEDPVMDANVIKEGLGMAEKLINHFVVNDPNKERVKKFQNDMKLLMAHYKELYKNRTKTTRKRPKTELFSKNDETSTQPIFSISSEKNLNETSIQTTFSISSEKELNFSGNFELVLIESDKSSVDSDITFSNIRNYLSLEN